MRVRIHHRTSYLYDEPATFGAHTIRLRPADHTRARLLSYNLGIAPKPAIHWQQDPWGNRIVRATFDPEAPVSRLDFTVDAAFDIHPVNPFDFYVEESFQDLPSSYPERLQRELAPFLTRPNLSKKTLAFAEAHRPSGYVTDYIVALNRAVAQTVNYVIRNEPGIQTSEETLEVGSGSCRDSAVLLVDVLRHHGFAARFVSGYLVQLTDEGNIPDEAKGVDRDVVDLHAWAEVYLPGAGWIGLDGTSGLLTGEGHIPLAGTADPSLAGPVEGTASRAAADLEVDMHVVRLGHEPRPRRPYTDEQWDAMLELGRAVDGKIADAGFSLTMGGEPTWTSRLHPTEPEWNGEALGATKWAAGTKMSQELLKRLAKGGLLLHRFGKHYPGETLPRWVMHLLWRPDGQPVWRNAKNLDLGAGGYAAVDDGRPVPGARGPKEAEAFRTALIERLGLSAKWIPGFEDPWHFIQEEENLPLDVDPLKADLEDSEERRRLARALGRGLGNAVGHAVPLGFGHEGWVTDEWTFRRGNMFLIPGDSPMGLRMPLARIGGIPFGSWEQDPSSLTEPLGPPPWERQPYLQSYPGLGSSGALHARAAAGEQLPHPQGAGEAQGLGGAGAPGAAAPMRAFWNHAQIPLLQTGERVRTALCVEPRGGVIHVFLPPVPTTDAFFDLIAAIEDAAESTGVPVAVEGYPPPKDPRLDAVLVTPDPGVIEVNMPVRSSFGDYVELMEVVSDAANHSGLTAERFQLDGRMAGSGGGHHLTLGGATPLESPFLSRPQMLGSFIRFFQNHPSLSYLFTGLFVGPTSQAPRLDEARHDALYELEIALKRLEQHERAPQPWLTDRLLRNLLVDVSGNTHRTEISIDKLYDPNLPSGRQGIVELRAFEMPPHERMAAAQMLLVRGIVAMISQQPYDRPLVRWGSQLHDRFMLPHFLEADLHDVLRELRQAGLPFEQDFFQPFVDFRCPLIGRHEMDDVEIELRTALEPWPVLGEEGAAFGTVRYVDSAVERVQVKVKGLTEGRHVVTVNDHRVPLRATGTATEGVAGVRFKAWQPPHGLQPTLPTHHPLRFDVLDTWAKRSLGAVTYHVWHPEGHGFNEPPLTAFEASARRAQRFTVLGHAGYPAEPIAASVHPEQPFSLDLRRFDVDVD